ncbi:hypothetical protein [Xanthomonas axonopodis]|uniref:hypothetical protein n=1 Tax=Xanthomonas axonopodis TaxID=53413 RepID=UPI0035587840
MNDPRGPIMKVPELAEVLAREIRQCTEHWWFHYELITQRETLPPSQKVAFLVETTIWAHFKASLLGIDCLVNAQKDSLSLEKFESQLDPKQGHGALRNQVQAVRREHAPRLQGGIKRLRDKIVVHWDWREHPRDVDRSVEVRRADVDAFLVACCGLLPELMQITDKPQPACVPSRDEIADQCTALLGFA